MASPIRVARLQAGYTQVDVARKLQVTQQAVGTWETGKASPNGKVLSKLSRLYHTPTDALLGLDQNRYLKQERRIRELERKVEELVKVDASCHADRALIL